MRWYSWAAIAAGVLLVTLGGKKVAALWAPGATARRLGIANTPDNADDLARLEWLSPRLTEVIELLSEKFSGVKMSSAYRSQALNDAMPGAAATSRHKFGLAFDLVWPGQDYLNGAKYLRANIGRLSVAPWTILPEYPSPHLHVDYYDPLKKLDKGEGATRYLVRTELTKYNTLPA
jgi:hypothetical protein